MLYSSALDTSGYAGYMTHSPASSIAANLLRLKQEFMDLKGLSEHTYQVYRELEREVIRNWTDQRSDWQYDLVKQPVIRATIILFYAIIIIVGVLSNGAVVIVAASTRKIHTVTNVFVVNLAISDLGMCMFNLPIQLHYQLTDRWIFGELLCRVVFSAFALPMYLSTVTILLIALDRYWLIVWPLKDRLSIRQAFLLIALNVIVSVTMATPVMYYTSLHVIKDDVLEIRKSLCVEKWPSDTERHIFTVFSFFFQFCLPLTLTSVLYLLIYNRLQRRRSPASLIARTAGAAIVPTGIPVSLRHTRDMLDSDLCSSVNNIPEINCESDNNHQDAIKETAENKIGFLAVDDKSRSSSLGLPSSQDVRNSICSTNLLCPPSKAPPNGSCKQIYYQAVSTTDLASDVERSWAPGMSPVPTRKARDSQFSDGTTQSRSNLAARRATARRSRKTNRILVAIVANFIVCWLPWNLFSLITEFSHSSVTGRHFKLVDLSLKGFAMASSCINPLLYCWLNESLRKDLSGIAIRLNVYRRFRPGIKSPGRITVPPAGPGGPPKGQAPEDVPCFNIQPPSEAGNSGEDPGSGRRSGGDKLKVPLESSEMCSGNHTASFTLERSSRQNSLF